MITFLSVVSAISLCACVYFYFLILKMTVLVENYTRVLNVCGAHMSELPEALLEALSESTQGEKQ